MNNMNMNNNKAERDKRDWLGYDCRYPQMCLMIVEEVAEEDVEKDKDKEQIFLCGSGMDGELNGNNSPAFSSPGPGGGGAIIFTFKALDHKMSTLRSYV